MATRKAWSKEEDRIVKDNYGKITYKEMGELLPGRTASSIQTRVSRLGFERDPNKIRRKQRKYSINLNYFKTPTVDNCYVAGFLAADGAIKEDQHSVRLILHPKDCHILEEIKGMVGFSGPIAEYKMNSSDTMYKALICNGVHEWIRDLKKHFNIIPKKSLILKPPRLEEEEHIKAFIRGYTDVDGSIFMRGDGGWCIQIIGTKIFLSWVKSCFDEWVSDYYKREAQVNKANDVIYQYRLSGDRALSILQSLLQVDTPFLKRKWQPVIDHLKTQ